MTQGWLWLVIVYGLVPGLIVGGSITWAVLSLRERRKKRRVR